MIARLPQIKSYQDAFFRNALSYSVEQVCNFEEARKIARGLSMSAFDVSEFPYIYFTAGITEALNTFLSESPFDMMKGDYRYVTVLPMRSGILTPEETAINRVLYLSTPSAINGRHVDLYQEWIQRYSEVFLDCAYMFASNMEFENRTLPQNIKRVAFSLSKSHNLADVRVGWILSRTPYRPLHALQYDYDYGNSIITGVMRQTLLEEPNYLYYKYKREYGRKYKRNKLIEGDTNLFGLDQNGGKIPFWTL